MKFNPIYHHRRSIRLPGYDYSFPGVYFITICTQNRECLFGDVMDGNMVLNEWGMVVVESWQWLAIQYNYVKLDKWILMPNHLHGIIIINGRGGSRTAHTMRTAHTYVRKPLGRLIGAFKTVSTKRINQIRKTPGATLWQRNYFERVIRNKNEWVKTKEYIQNNPILWVHDSNHPKNSKMNR